MNDPIHRQRKNKVDSAAREFVQRFQKASEIWQQMDELGEEDSNLCSQMIFYCSWDCATRVKMTHNLVVQMRELGVQDSCLCLGMMSLFDEANACDFSELESRMRLLKCRATFDSLKLVLWKVACILNPDRTLTSVLDVLSWVRSEWKKQKAAMRRHEMITVIMVNVRPFLDKP